MAKIYSTLDMKFNNKNLADAKRMGLDIVSKTGVVQAKLLIWFYMIKHAVASLHRLIFFIYQWLGFTYCLQTFSLKLLSMDY